MRYFTSGGVETFFTTDPQLENLKKVVAAIVTRDAPVGIPMRALKGWKKF